MNISALPFASTAMPTEAAPAAAAPGFAGLVGAFAVTPPDAGVGRLSVDAKTPAVAEAIVAPVAEDMAAAAPAAAQPVIGEVADATLPLAPAEAALPAPAPVVETELALATEPTAAPVDPASIAAPRASRSRPSTPVAEQPPEVKPTTALPAEGVQEVGVEPVPQPTLAEDAPEADDVDVELAAATPADVPSPRPAELPIQAPVAPPVTASAAPTEVSDEAPPSIDTAPAEPVAVATRSAGADTGEAASIKVSTADAAPGVKPANLEGLSPQLVSQALPEPVSRVHGQPYPGAAVTQNQPVVAARPGQIGRDMGVEIARQVKAGKEEVLVRLDPAEMGRIDVRLSFDRDGTLRAVMAADSPAALDMLRREAGDLSRALTDAGVRADTQSFRFDSRSGDAGQSWQRGQQGGDGRSAQGGLSRNGGETIADEPVYQPLRASGRVDLMA